MPNKYIWIAFERSCGFIVLAGIHSELIDSSCDECTNDLIKKQRGCEKPTQIPVWVTGEYEFYVCPLSFLSLQIKQWYNKYIQIKNGVCKSVDYNKTNPKFFEAIRIYEHYLQTFKQDKIDIDKNKKDFKKLEEIKQWQPKK